MKFLPTVCNSTHWERAWNLPMQKIVMMVFGITSQRYPIGVAKVRLELCQRN